MGSVFRAMYVDDQENLNIEIVAPGRSHENIDVEQLPDHSLYVVVKELPDTPPGSLLSSMTWWRINIPEKWNPETVRATCKEGLLTLRLRTYEKRPSAKERADASIRKPDFADTIKFQRPGLN